MKEKKNNKKLCEFCNERIAWQQKWRKWEEKKYCVPCWEFITYARGIEKVLTNYLKKKLRIKDKVVRFKIRNLTFLINNFFD